MPLCQDQPQVLQLHWPLVCAQGEAWLAQQLAGLAQLGQAWAVLECWRLAQPPPLLLKLQARPVWQQWGWEAVSQGPWKQGLRPKGLGVFLQRLCVLLLPLPSPPQLHLLLELPLVQL